MRRNRVIKQIKILGNGQIWDSKGIDPDNPDKNFEDLFSGRALAALASDLENKIITLNRGKRVFSEFLEAGKNQITGVSVSRALISKDKFAQKCAKEVLSVFALNGARGIESLNNGKAIKPKWTKKERGFWQNLSGVVIGGGVSEEESGKFIVNQIKKILASRNLGHIQIYQARFPGKESGFLGATAFCLPLVLKASPKNKKIGIIGLDIGRADIGLGALVFNGINGELIKYARKEWLFKEALSTPHANLLHIFKDSFRKYSKKETILGKKIRDDLINAIAQLIIKAIGIIQKKDMQCSKFIGIGLPGETDHKGFMIGSTHYFPFLEKKDNFHFSEAIKKRLEKFGHKGYNIQILNDGIAAGLANLRFGIGLSKLKPGKYAFLGPGSGLGGCVAEVIKK